MDEFSFGCFILQTNQLDNKKLYPLTTVPKMIHTGMLLRRVARISEEENSHHRLRTIVTIVTKLGEF